jgi:hypothetical protein
VQAGGPPAAGLVAAGGSWGGSSAGWAASSEAEGAGAGNDLAALTTSESRRKLAPLLDGLSAACTDHPRAVLHHAHLSSVLSPAHLACLSPPAHSCHSPVPCCPLLYRALPPASTPPCLAIPSHHVNRPHVVLRLTVTVLRRCKSLSVACHTLLFSSYPLPSNLCRIPLVPSATAARRHQQQPRPSPTSALRPHHTSRHHTYHHHHPPSLVDLM